MMIRPRRPRPPIRYDNLKSLLNPFRNSSSGTYQPYKFFWEKEPLPLPGPDGGELVDLVAPEADRPALRDEAAALPAVKLRRVDLEWAHVLADGWASPLCGFMRPFEYAQALRFGSLRVGGPDRDEPHRGSTAVNMPLPIVLPISDADFDAVESTLAPHQCSHFDVALLGPSGDLVGILRNAQIYSHNQKEMIFKLWGPNALRMAYVKEVISQSGDTLIGGDLVMLEPVRYKDGLDHYRLSPQELRKEFDRLEADAVVAFQLWGPLHNGHAVFANYIHEKLLAMGYKKPILLLHPLGGFTKAHNLPLNILMEQHSKVLEDGLLDPTTTVMAIFPSPMNYPGPTEVQWHAKARINAGVNFFVADHWPTGLDNEEVYLQEWVEAYFELAPGLDKISRIDYHKTAYDPVAKKMTFLGFDRKYHCISETMMRRYAINGKSPPDGFMCASGWEVLANYYESTKNKKASQH